jgi:predicted signal transduction protein with EAL and GGDEF domain
MSNSALDGIFKHSSKTISKQFEEVFLCVVAMSVDYIRPMDPNFSATHTRISRDRRMMPYFKICIDALDGTDISATPRSEDLIRYIGQSGISNTKCASYC